MPNEQITQFTALGTTPASGDQIPIVDVSDTTDAPTGTTKRVAFSDLIGTGVLGDVVGPSSSVDSEIALFSSTTGKVIKRATTTGLLKATSGVLGSTGANANDLASPIYAADGGSTDSYAITLSPAPASYQTGALYRFKANTANTGACSLDVNSLGAKTIKKVQGGITTDLDNNDIRVGQFVDLVYDGTNFQMQSTLGNAPSSGAPSNATYITQTADGTLSNEQALGSLATGILKSTTTTGVVSIADVNDISSPVYAADAGANDTYAATLSPVPSAYVTGAHYRFKANTANTGACTINFNSLGAKTIKKAAGGITTDLADNDIRAGQWVDLVYDGTNMQMQSTLGNAGSGGTPGGANTQVQFNDSSAFGGDAGFTFNKATGDVVISNHCRVGAGTAGAPALSFNSTTHGFYTDAGPIIVLSLGGVAKVVFDDEVHVGNAGGFKISSTSAPTGSQDSGICRYAANQTQAIRNSLNAIGEFVARAFYCEPRTFANLPTGAEGMIARITNCNTTTVGATAAGGGSSHVYVAHDGSNWLVLTAF